MKKLHFGNLLFFILLTVSVQAIACKCATLPPISKEEAKRYDVIFFGKVDSVGTCIDGNATAYFTIQELYKGNSKQQCEVSFDCASSCLMSFAKGEEWLIYGIYKKFGVAAVNICDHNRKQLPATEQDFYEATAQRTFDQEKTFLKTELGIQSFIQTENWNKAQEDLKPRNEQPTDMSKLILLVVSFVVMIIIYIITRKKKSKND